MNISSYLYGRMEKGLQKIISNGKDTEGNDGLPIKKDNNALLTFAVWGDPQISFISPLRSARVYRAVRDLKNADSLDALVLCGDITEYGAKCEYKFVKRLLDGLGGGVQRIFAVTGNHDIRLRNHKKQIKRFQNFILSLEKGDTDYGDSTYYTRDINGCRFIMMGTDRATFEAAYISDTQLERLKKDILSAPEGKPVFVFNHQTLKLTNGLPKTFLGKGKWRGSVGRESEKLKNVLSVRKNVFFITGHLHYCTSEYTYEDCGNFKALSVPTVGVINHGKFKTMTQGYVISVYGDKIVMRSRVFGEGKYAPESVPNSYIEVAL